jgi:aminoglycoside phosphotransferase (APT) family kinase protein
VAQGKKMSYCGGSGLKTDMRAGMEAVVAAAEAAWPGMGLAVVCGRGHDSLALELGGRWILKVPLHAQAEARLRREASVLAMLQGRVNLPIPRMELHPGPPLFTRHAKLPGHHLPPFAYANLGEAAKAQLARDLAQFFADLHAIPVATAREAGALPVPDWLPSTEIAARALPHLPPILHNRATATLSDWAALPPDPLGQVYGFFDGHGWNMAFDEGRLRGIYDFADSGLGDLHREFVYPSLISPDLVHRILPEYRTLTGRPVDPARINLLTTAHRLWELAEAQEDLAARIAGAVDSFAR